MGIEQERVVVEPVEKPTKEYELPRVVDVRIDSSAEQYLSTLGGGDISAGVRIAAKFHKDAQARNESGAGVITQSPAVGTRVNWTQLDQRREGSAVTYRGKPFSGIAFEIAPNGQLVSEAEYRDGKRFGLSRDWSIDGVLISEVCFRADVAQGRRRIWYWTGAPKSDGQYEWGICLAEREWDQHGTLRRDFVLKETDPQFRTLQRLRAERVGEG
jgi:hypothetical protein